MRDQLNALNTDKASPADVAAAITGTANNMNAVSDLTVPISDLSQARGGAGNRGQDQRTPRRPAPVKAHTRWRCSKKGGGA